MQKIAMDHSIPTQPAPRNAVLRGLLLVTLIAVASGAGAAAPDARTVAEVNHLLTFAAASGCKFERKGTWHVSAEARKHLEQKYQYLVKQGWIASAEDFIERAASKSSISGREYRVQCDGAPIITGSQWLSSELARYRRTRAATPATL